MRPVRGVGVATAFVATICLVGCSPGGQAQRTEEARVEQFETPASASLTDAGEVLELVGLTLPADATDVVVERRELKAYTWTANYVVRFTASPESVRAFAAQFMEYEYYPGSRPSTPMGIDDWSVYDGTWDRGFEEFGLDTAPAGSRFSDHAVHTPTGVGGVSVLAEGPDLTRVHVGIQLATR